jgi:hypothetical protein
VHDDKQFSPRNVTERGREIDFNAEQRKNASRSISRSFDPESKDTDESDVHDMKDLSLIMVTEGGMEIDVNEEQR